MPITIKSFIIITNIYLNLYKKNLINFIAIINLIVLDLI